MFLKRYGREYRAVHAPRGFTVRHLPRGCERIRHRGKTYYYDDGVYYVHHPRSRSYEVVRPPRGIAVRYLPDDRCTVRIRGEKFYVWGDVHYKKERRHGDTFYVSVRF